MRNSQMRVIGLMSGTSLDGVDLAEVIFSITRKKVKYRFVKGKTYPYPAPLLQKLQKSRSLSGLDLILLDRELGKFYGKQILNFCGKNQPDLISSHGHTIFHQPEKGLTLQVGSGAEIASLTGIKTICDFRSTDLALGGQGAPLVPFGDELLFSAYDYCLNLGGYSNISYKQNGKRVAFDVSVCNVLLNRLAAERNREYDTGGKLASEGKLNHQLFRNLNAIEFYHRSKNISLGNEWFEEQIWPHFKRSTDSTENKLCTACEHIAFQISRILKEDTEVLITGGGAFNQWLINRIEALSGAKIILPEKEIIQFKEAILFALLGYMREKEWINTFSSVTGAKRDSSGGAIYFP